MDADVGVSELNLVYMKVCMITHAQNNLSGDVTLPMFNCLF